MSNKEEGARIKAQKRGGTKEEGGRSKEKRHRRCTTSTSKNKAWTETPDTSRVLAGSVPACALSNQGKREHFPAFHAAWMQQHKRESKHRWAKT